MLNLLFYMCEKLTFFISEPETVHVVSTFIELPEGASLSDNEDNDHYDINDPHRALDIDLDV